MAGFFTRLFSKATPKGIPEDRDARNLWIEARFGEWQARWHDLFDLDRILIEEGDVHRPETLPADAADDNRLVFGFSRATPETRRECMASFPAGAEMHRRFETYMTGKSVAISEADARQRLGRVVVMLERIGPNEPVNFSNVRIIDRETDDGEAEIGRTGDITELLEGSLLEPTPVGELERHAARLFLMEPLYVAADNFPHVADWVTSAMVGGATDGLHTALYDLWDGGWQVCFDDEGVVLASREV